MKRSRAELKAHVLRAGRGAGLPLAQAEDVALVAADLVAAGGATELPGALQGPFGRIDFARARVALAGPAAIDLAGAGATVPIADADAPQLLVALVRQARRAGLAVALTAHGNGWRLAPCADPVVEAAPGMGPVEVSDEVWEALDVLARRTYVPATDASRQGAGQGSDGD